MRSPGGTSGTLQLLAIEHPGSATQRVICLGVARAMVVVMAALVGALVRIFVLS